MRVARWALALAVCAACSSYGETSPPASADGGSVPPVASDAGPTDAGASGDGGTFCAANGTKKLCDDFEGRTSAGDKWSFIKAEGVPATALQIVGEEPPWDSAFLRVRVPQITASQGGWSYLVHEVPDAPASITVGLTMLATGFTGSTEYVEVATIGGSNPERLVPLFIEGGKINLGSRETATSMAVGNAGVRTRYELTVSGTTVTLRANGTQVAETTLVGAPFTAPMYVGVGLAYSEVTQGGTIEIDDVVVDY